MSAKTLFSESLKVTSLHTVQLSGVITNTTTQTKPCSVTPLIDLFIKQMRVAWCALFAKVYQQKS